MLLSRMTGLLLLSPVFAQASTEKSVNLLVVKWNALSHLQVETGMPCKIGRHSVHW